MMPSTSSSPPLATAGQPTHLTRARTTSAALASILATLRATPWTAEAAGAVGDLGTFLPLTLGLVSAAGLDLGTTLVGTGLYNLLSGWLFGVPMPVQPMKTIAAVAIAAAPGAAGLPAIMAAGMFVSAAALLLGVTRLADASSLLVPLAVVRGLQLGVGLKLAASGLKQALLLPAVKKEGAAAVPKGALAWRALQGTDGLIAGALALAFLLVTTIARPADDPADAAAAAAATGVRERLLGWRRRRMSRRADTDKGAPASSSNTSSEVEGAAAAAAAPHPLPPPPCSSSIDARPWPSALILIVLGLVVACATAPRGTFATVRLGPSKPNLIVPDGAAWVAGMTSAGGLAQLPLTLLNSVVAVSALADCLYAADRPPAAARRWRPSVVATSVGLMNLAGAWFGVMPACHGAGGLAAQHRFGARTGVAPMLLGGVKLVLGLLFGSSLATILALFPQTILGALMAVAGAELACSARREAGPRGFTLLALTAGAILAFDDTAVGFLVGWSGWVVSVGWEAAGRVCAKLTLKWRRRRGGEGTAACAV